jgi:hypothetical protein
MDNEILGRINKLFTRLNKTKDVVVNMNLDYVRLPIYSQVDSIISDLNQLHLEAMPQIDNVSTYESAGAGRVAYKDVVLAKIAEIEGHLEPLMQIKKEILIEPVELVRKICSRFHAVARQIRDRRNGRSTLDVQDEYDVQNLIHALLKIHFDDIRPEEWTPSYAGGSSRMDFLLKNEKIVIEVKKTRQNLTERDIGTQLIEDIERYKEHPDCGLLFCFIYDPEGRIGNPRGLENDLSKDNQRVKVEVAVFPRD